ncbi:MAG TPA: alpha/beta hydrolase [Clostridia bacterium]|nr:alpha/beta hydrolase [Clostridia bacterium]
MYTAYCFMLSVRQQMATDLLPKGLLVLLIGLLAVILAYISFELHLGWSLFRYATKRAKKEDRRDTSYVPQETLDWYKIVEDKKEDVFAFPHETLEMEIDGLTLRGVYFPSHEHASSVSFADGCAVLVHGWRDVHFSRAVDVMMYLDAGFSVFVPYLRGHEPSEGKYIDLGCRYRKDLFSWMEQIRVRPECQTPSYFVLDGLSMGAATVLTASGDHDLPTDVRAVLADCGYTSFLEQGKWMIRGMKPMIRYPAFLFTLVFLWLIMGYKRSDPTPLKQVKKASVPIMIIHGEDDLFVPPSMSKELYDACASEQKDYWLVSGAKHAMSQRVAGDEYWSKKRAFIEQALKRSPVKTDHS